LFHRGDEAAPGFFERPLEGKDLAFQRSLFPEEVVEVVDEDDPPGDGAFRVGEVVGFPRWESRQCDPLRVFFGLFSEGDETRAPPLAEPVGVAVSEGLPPSRAVAEGGVEGDRVPPSFWRRSDAKTMAR
jgi:hypothetical protein